MEKAMQKYLDKAEVLIEALPYIQRFNRKVIVVKYGGSAMVDEEIKSKSHSGCNPSQISWIQTDHRAWRWQGDQQMGWKSRHGTGHFINGLRVTDAETMETRRDGSW